MLGSLGLGSLGSGIWPETLTPSRTPFKRHPTLTWSRDLKDRLKVWVFFGGLDVCSSLWGTLQIPLNLEFQTPSRSSRLVSVDNDLGVRFRGLGLRLESNGSLKVHILTFI